jgi:uncharacterized membrane protein (DUF485 family)
MNADLLARIGANPKYRQLVRRRRRFAWLLTALMFGVYYGYVGLIAFDKSVLARPIGSSVISTGIPVGLGLIVFTILITGVYVVRANGEFDRVTREILEEAGA